MKKIRNRFAIQDYLYASLFAALISVLGYLSLPLFFSPVPVTGQSLGIMLAGSVLSTGQAFLSLLTFLLLGLVGVPVFSGGTAGFGRLIGPTGGYLIGFLVGVAVITIIRDKLPENIFNLALANFIGGIVIVYIFGATWMHFLTGMGFKAVFASAILPFIPGDLFKMVVATIAGSTIKKRLPR